MTDGDSTTKQSRLSWFPLYVNEWVGGTLGMTAQELGQYMMLLVAQWQSQNQQAIRADRLPAFLQGSPLEAAVRLKFEVVEIDGKDCLRNPRLASEWEKARNAHRQRVEAGRKRSLQRWGSDRYSDRYSGTGSGTGSGRMHNSHNVTKQHRTTEPTEPPEPTKPTPTTTGGGLGEGGIEPDTTTAGILKTYVAAYNRVFGRRCQIRAVVERNFKWRIKDGVDLTTLSVLAFYIPGFNTLHKRTLQAPEIYLRDETDSDSKRSRVPIKGWTTWLLRYIETGPLIARKDVEIAKDMGLWPTLTALGAREAPPPDPKVALYDR